jgi:hypothetical protein
MPSYPDALLASDYVVCATLCKVADVFNADFLWERGRKDPEGMCLAEALKRHPRTTRARTRQEIRFSHVVVRVPERDYLRDDRLEEGFGRRALLSELQRLHQSELSHYLAEDACVRYRIEPDAQLRPGEVQFLFGRAIYLPADDESPAFRIQAAAQANQANGEEHWRTVGMIYPGQRLTLLNGDRRTSTFAVSGWPFMAGESVLLLLRAELPLRVDGVAEPGGSLSLECGGNGEVTVRDRRTRVMRLRIAALALELQRAHNRREQLPLAAATGESRLLSDESENAYPLIDHWGRREPVLGIPIAFEEAPAMPEWSAPAPEQSQPVQLNPAPAEEMEPEPASEPASEPEPDAGTWLPRQAPVYLHVVGIALQRLSAYAAAGIRDWRIHFNRDGGLVPGRHPDAVACLRIDSADQVFGDSDGGSAPLSLPGFWQPLPGLAMELCAAPVPLAGHYLGWVRLPAPLALPVLRDRAFSFGRGAEADIAPRLLADPRALRWGEEDPVRATGINAEYLGLSRRHLSLQVRRDDWWVQLESQNMPVYRLSATGEPLGVLAPQAETTTTAQPGDLLVVGGYVLALGTIPGA